MVRAVMLAGLRRRQTFTVATARLLRHQEDAGRRAFTGLGRPITPSNEGIPGTSTLESFFGTVTGDGRGDAAVQEPDG